MRSLPHSRRRNKKESDSLQTLLLLLHQFPPAATFTFFYFVIFQRNSKLKFLFRSKSPSGCDVTAAIAASVDGSSANLGRHDLPGDGLPAAVHPATDDGRSGASAAGDYC
jgi:hypothetical protein